MMRDRLIELMKYRRHLETSELADVLLENGIIVPPCKVGDTVYFVAGDEVMFSLVEKIKIEQAARFNPEMVFNSIYLVGVFNPIPFDLIGKTVFLAREEAEAALNGGEG